MPIQALPQSTARLLSSAQVLTDPASVVKELLDNALDAQATSIEVLISANALDRIEVRDNGHGIATHDLNVLGRRGHTSKLRTFEDLASVGGRSLGFRGEALASATILGQVSLTTRTEGQDIATHVKLDVSGGVTSQSPASHPIGTTFSITNLFAQVPVRKQHFLKDAAKQLVKIRSTLQRYAIARRHIRLRLKVLKTPKLDWNFAPRLTDSLKDTIAQVLGREIAGQCTEMSSKSVAESAQNSEITRTSPRTSKYSFEACLPTPGADIGKMFKGQYLSIDSRPVSATQGSLKKIVIAFKVQLVKALPDSCTVKEPFLCLNIKCPASSYDPNVEPAKDDVIFVDEYGLLEEAETFFTNIYRAAAIIKQSRNVGSEEPLEDNSQKISNPGPISDTASNLVNPIIAGNSFRAVNRRYNENMTNEDHTISFNKTRGPPPLVTLSNNISRDCNTIDKGTSAFSDIQRPVPYPIVSTLGDDDQIQAVHQDQTDAVMEENEKANIMRGINPWVVAKEVAPIQRRKILRSGRNGDLQSPETAKESTIITARQAFLESEPSHEPRTWTQIGGQISDEPETIQLEHSFVQSNLHNWMQGIESERTYKRGWPSQKLNEVDDDEMLLGDSENRNQNQTMRERPVCLTAAPEIVLRTGLDSPPRTQERPNPKRARTGKGGLNKPFVPPSMKTPRATIVQSGVPSHMPTPRKSPRDLRSAAIEDQDHISLRTTNVRQSVNNSTIVQPHLHMGDEYASPLNDKVPVKTSIPDGDPRAYLMRRQKSMNVNLPGTSKLKRAKTALMPLENVPDQYKIHNLEQCIESDITCLSQQQILLARFDTYIQAQEPSPPSVMDLIDIYGLQGKIETLVKDWNGHWESHEMTYNIRDVTDAYKSAALVR